MSFLRGAACAKVLRFALGLIGAPSAMADIQLSVVPSRTSGVAPLAVYFDARDTTGLAEDDFVNAHFFWDFDTTDVNPAGRHQQSKGFVCAHVFEQPGTYTVKVEVFDRSGAKATRELTITALPFEGTTFYVSADGNDSNPGTSEAAPFRTSARAFSAAVPYTRILFRRGDTFPGVSGMTGPASPGPGIIGAYGSGAAPILTLNVTKVEGVVRVGGPDWRVMDLHLKGLAPLIRDSSPTGLATTNNASHTLLYRTEIERVGSSAVSSQADYLFLVDNEFHTLGPLGWIGQSTPFIAIGNVLRDFAEIVREHGFRFHGSGGAFIAYNRFTLGYAKSAVQIRGAGRDNDAFQRDCILLGNYADQVMGFNPTDPWYITDVYRCLAEDNVVAASAFINVVGRDCVVRNNVALGDQGLAKFSASQHFYPRNNWFYNNVMATSAKTMVSITGGDVRLFGNLFRTTSTSNEVGVYQALANDAPRRSEDNLLWAPQATGRFWVQQGSKFQLPQWQARGYDLASLIADPMLASLDPVSPLLAQATASSPAAVREGRIGRFVRALHGDPRPLPADSHPPAADSFVVFFGASYPTDPSWTGQQLQRVNLGGSTTAVTVSVPAGRTFLGWSLDHKALTTMDNPVVVTDIRKDTKVTAHFSTTSSVNVVRFTTDATPGARLQGDVFQVVSAGSPFPPTAVTAVPPPGYRFTGWTGAVTSSANPLSLPFVSSSITVQANFAPETASDAPDSSYSQWVAARLTGTAEADGDDDPDKDGHPNFLEYALGSDPRAPGAAPAGAGVSAGQRLALTFLRARSGVTYTIEGSSDFSSWQTVAINPGVVGQQVTVEDTVSTSPRFLRVRVAAAP